jgi:asparagine synthase (glutamine-hydrolysing)
LNKYAIYSFLHLGYVHEPHTIYSSVKKFPAGFFGSLQSPGKLILQPYWKTGDHLTRSKQNNEKVTMVELKNKLSEGVRKRLISDVPLGTFLSGGTDSSLVTALASGLVVGKLKTFCIGFSENKFDESEYARRVARHLNTDHHEYILSEKEAVDILETYLDHFDEPFADTSAIPTMLVSQLARKEVTVALTGDGGDELFLGYGAYNWANRINNPWLSSSMNPLYLILKNTGNSRLKRISHMFEKVKSPYLRSHIFSQEQYFFTQNEIRNDLLAVPDSFEFVYEDPATDALTPAEMQSLFDIRYYLKDDLLVKLDRASMYYALECRSPLLDHHIIEYVILKREEKYGNGFLRRF